MKKRQPPRVFMWSAHHGTDQDIDLAMVDKNGKVVLIDAKTGTVQFPDLIQAKYDAGQMRLLFEDKIDQLRLYEAVARSLSPGAEVVSPLALDPPKLADFLISLIPIKHRENPAGDLEEDYWNRLIPRHGLRKARFLFWAQVAYALLGFLARPLAQIAGIGWIARLIEILVHKMMR